MDNMSDAAFNRVIELLAVLVETKATTVEEAVELIREAKIEA